MPDSAVELELGCGFAAEIRNELSHSLLNFKVSKTEAAYRSIRFALRLVSSLAGDFLKRHAKGCYTEVRTLRLWHSSKSSELFQRTFSSSPKIQALAKFAPSLSRSVRCIAASLSA